MSFNWFRRQHDDSSASTETQVQSETSSNQEVSPESVPETIIDPADLLAYAKAAYKNIQQKQQSQDQEGTTVTDEASSVTTSETSEISEDSSVIKDEIHKSNLNSIFSLSKLISRDLYPSSKFI